jgi:hypothetical protein
VSRRGRLVASLLAALILAAPSTAAAQDVGGSELVALAERASGDPDAREQLLAVQTVEGRPVAVREALQDARGAELERRARLIAASVEAAGEAPPATESRREAREVLDERRFHGAELPRPFAGPLAWLGDRVEPVADWINDRGARVPGGPIALWTVLAAGVLLAAGTITSTTIRRRALAIERARTAALPATEDPRALEREAERAERDADWERAVRLRFRAGLLRLDRRKVIVYRPSLTTGEVARAVDSPAFREVGDRFDAIAYGGRPADRDEADAARRGWDAVLGEAARRDSALVASGAPGRDGEAAR